MGMPVCLKSVKLRMLLLIGFVSVTTLMLILFTSIFLYHPLYGGVSSESSVEIEHQFPKIVRQVAYEPPASSNPTEVSQIDTLVSIPPVSLLDDFDKIRHNQNNTAQPGLEFRRQASNFINVVENRLIHFDFKGAPPKVVFIKETVLLAKQAGITGVLLEWEDTFPWKNILKNSSVTEGGYSDNDVEEIIQFIESQGMEVIPLIQTFGHVEYILKSKDFGHLRELEEDPQSFCPLKPQTIELLEEMVDQIITVHSNSKFVHIGCDEVFNLRLCPVCTSNSESREELFLHHVSVVAQLVRDSGRIPIIWDDMLRTMTYDDLLTSNIGSLVEIMIWVYAEEVDRYVGYDSWEKYGRIFPTIWIAGAFKGSSGERTQIPDVKRHLDNTFEWLEVISRESKRWTYGLGGFVLTGWSRYDHFAVLCELLPAAIPSLVYLSLQLATPLSDSSGIIRNRFFLSSTDVVRRRRSGRHFVIHPQTLRKTEPQPQRLRSENLARSPATIQRNERIWQEFSKILHCPYIKETNLTDLASASKCSWNGVGVFRALFTWRDLISEVEDTLESIRKRGWLTEYNVQHSFSLPLRVNELLSYDIPRLKRNLAQKAKSIAISLQSIYSNVVILEWLEQNIWSTWKKLKSLENTGNDLKKLMYWPRRPIQTPIEIVTDLGLQPIQLMNKTEL